MSIGYYMETIIHDKAGAQKIQRGGPCLLKGSHSNYRWLDCTR